MQQDQDPNTSPGPETGDGDSSPRAARKNAMVSRIGRGVIGRINARLDQAAFGAPEQDQHQDADQHHDTPQIDVDGETEQAGPNTANHLELEAVVDPQVTMPMSALTDLVVEAAKKYVDETAGASRPGPFDSNPDEVQVHLAAAGAVLRSALSAQRVGLTNSKILSGSFTSHGQRWVVKLLGGLTVADAVAKIDNLEAAWEIPEGGAVYIARDTEGSKNQAVITRLDSDPLAKVTRTARIPFGSVSIRDLVRVGTFENGDPDLLSLLRRNIGIIAANRSGKSTIHWNILNHLTACRDAVYWLIDLQGSAALRMWEPTAGLCAWTIEDARILLRSAFALAQYRANGLGLAARDYVMNGLAGDLDVNHFATPEDPALVILIDEGSLLAQDRECVQLIIDIERTGPKADVTIAYANQRGTDAATGSADIRKEWGERLLLRCEESDVDHVLGQDQRLSGWAAHRINLQGVYYHRNTIDGGIQAPLRARSTWPEPSDMAPGIREALGRRPVFAPRLTRVLPYAIQPESFPEAAAAIAHQLELDGRNRITPEDFASRLASRDRRAWGHLDNKALTARLKPYGQEPRSMKFPGEEGNKSGLTIDQFNSLQPLEGASQ